MPQKSQTIVVAGYDAAIVQALAYGTLVQLDWTIKYAGSNILIGYTPKTWKTKDNEITIETKDNELSITSKTIHDELFDIMGRNKKNIAAFLTAFETTKATITVDQIHDWSSKIGLLREETIEIAEQQVKQAEEIEKVMNLSSGNMYVTYAIMGINMLMFIIMVINGVDFFSPKPWEVLRWGGSFPAMDLSGDWWRSFTCMFLHFGIIHLALNMYALYSVSTYLEPMLGKSRFIAAYTCSGWLASIISTVWRKDEFIVGAGASGAIFGMYGMFLALLTTNIIPRQARQTMLQSILLFVAYNVFYGFKSGSGIDNAAHLGGLLSGMMIGYIYYLSFKNPSAPKTNTITGLIALSTGIILFTVFRNEKTTPVKVDFTTGQIYTNDKSPTKEESQVTMSPFEQKMKEFENFEKKALAPDNSDKTTSQEQIDEYIEISLPAWDKAEKITGELQSIAGTTEEKHTVSILSEYVKLRKQWSTLQIKRLQQNSPEVINEITEVVKKINHLFEELPASQ